VWNVYGPTETTIWSSVYCVRDGDYDAIPIGRPVANTWIHIVDAHGNPVPLGVSGEIYIGGEGLARGYLNRPKLTAERFVSNWLAPEQSPRLYRTGDLGRFRNNGDIEYLGRVDSQIKLRGQRVELGEIESILVGQSAGREAVVVGAGEKRRYVRSNLPEHMVPSSYWRIEQLPLWPSGKVNRGALGKCGGMVLAEGEEWVGPRTETEAELAKIWEELLKVQRVGVEQNFFELGGHSLLVLQMTARMRRVMEVEMQVRSVFENPTIAGLAREVEQARALGLKARAPILQPHHRPAANSDEEAILSQLQKLPAEEARNILKSALEGKQSYGAQP
jgi:hypothetical protein